MNNTIQLYMDENEEIEGYPITSPDRVIDENGITIKEQLDNIKEKEIIILPSNNDTKNIQNALDLGFNVRLVKGVYYISKTLIIKKPSQQLVGNGFYKTRIVKKDGFIGNSIIEVNGIESPAYRTDILIKDLEIDGVDKTTTGLELSKSADFLISKIKITNCLKGINIYGSLIYKIENSEISKNDIGIYFNGVTDQEIATLDLSPSNISLFDNLRIFGNNVAISQTTNKHVGANILFNGCEIEANGENEVQNRPCIYVYANTQTGNNNIMSFTNCWFERNVNNDVMYLDINNPNAINIDFCTMLNAANSNNRMIYAKGNGYLVINNVIDNSQYKIATIETEMDLNVISYKYFTQKSIIKNKDSIFYDMAQNRFTTDFRLYASKLKLMAQGGSGYAEIFNFENHLKLANAHGSVIFEPKQGEFWGCSGDYSRPLRIGNIYIWMNGDSLRCKYGSLPQNANDGKPLIEHLTS